MSKADQFRQYAEEDVRWARRSTIDKEKKALLELAHHWMLVALQSENTSLLVSALTSRESCLSRRPEAIQILPAASCPAHGGGGSESDFFTTGGREVALKAVAILMMW